MTATIEPELLTDHFTYWGLNYDPFDPDTTSTAFFSGAQRGPIVSQLVHFCQFGSGVLVVESEAGAGRKLIVQQVQRQMTSSAILELDVSVLTDPSQIFFKILERMEPDQPVASLGIGQVLAELRHLLQLGSARGAGLVVSLFNPELLDDKVVGALMTLLQDSPDDAGPSLKLLFWSDASMTKRLDDLGLFDVTVCDLTIPRMSCDEISEYLEFLLKEAGAQEFLFSAAECEAIWRQSNGLPGRANAFARAILLRKLPESSGRRVSTGMPVHYMMLLVLLVGALLMLLFYGFEREVEEGQVAAGESPVKAVVALDALELKEVVVEESLPEVAAQAVAVGRVAEGQDAVGDPLVDVVDVAGAAGVADMPEHAGVNVESADVSVDMPQSLGVDQGSQQDEVKPVVENTELKEAIATGSAVKSSDTTVSEKQSDAFILAQSGDAYFLQVLAAASFESVSGFIRRQPNRGDLHYYKGRRGGKDWYVVLSGPYESLEMARSAIQFLPEEQKKLSPWPRSAKEVKSKIEENKRF